MPGVASSSQELCNHRPGASAAAITRGVDRRTWPNHRGPGAAQGTRLRELMKRMSHSSPPRRVDLPVSGARVSKIEKGELERSEVETLAAYVKALSGKLKIIADYRPAESSLRELMKTTCLRSSGSLALSSSPGSDPAMLSA